MATPFSKLRKSNFWNQKIDRFMRAQDTDKSGDISRADFELIGERCRKLYPSNLQHIEEFGKYQAEVLNRQGFTDESVKLSYKEFKETFTQSLTKSEYELLFENMFKTLDLNEDGIVSFEEWTSFYHCMGIDQAYARASFDAMDQDSDGVVSKEEFVNFLCEYYFTEENKLGSAILYGPLD